MKQGQRKRTQKWYLENEKKVMNKFGFKPQPGSGNGDKFKEDGENDYSLAQLKSTDKDSYIFKLLDFKKLEHHAHDKLPVFITEFIGRETLITINSNDMYKFAELILKGGFKKESYNLDDDIEMDNKTIKSKSKQEEEELSDMEHMFKQREQRNKRRKW